MTEDDPRSFLWHIYSRCLTLDYYVEERTGEKVVGAAQVRLKAASSYTAEELEEFNRLYPSWYRKDCAWAKYMFRPFWEPKAVLPDDGYELV